MLNKKLTRGGYIANYSTNVDDTNTYMLYDPPPPDNLAAIATSTDMLNMPGLRVVGGSADINDKMEITGNEFFYSMDGGCATCGSCGTTSGGSKQHKGGVGLELAPFISALALLGARLLADEKIGIFNSSEDKQISSSKYRKSRH